MHLLLINLFNPLILFFLVGSAAAYFRTGLRIPRAIVHFLSLYVLVVIGLKGGERLFSANGDFLPLILGALISALIALYTFFGSRPFVGTANSSALAACYGSISITTFIAAASFAERFETVYSGAIVATIAIMEFPPLWISLLLYRKEKSLSLWQVFKQPSLFLLLGSLLTGAIIGTKGMQPLSFFTDNLFQGLLLFYLLEAGLRVGEKLHERKLTLSYVLAGSLLPLVNGLTAILIAALCGLNAQESFFLATLAAGSSYIVAPAVIRSAIPEADIDIYIPMALVVTFPVNLLIGIPLFWKVAMFINS